MFSSSTIESSTTTDPNASPPSVKTFNDCPEKYSRTNVAMIDSGIATATIPAARSDSRKIKITSTRETATLQRFVFQCFDRIADVSTDQTK